MSSSILRRSALSVVAVAGLIIAGVPSIASATEQSSDFYIGGGDGATVGQSIQAAIHEQGAEVVGAGLSALIHSAEQGHDVAFPGLEDRDPAFVAESLSALKNEFIDQGSARSNSGEFVDWTAFGDDAGAVQPFGLVDFHGINPNIDVADELTDYTDVRGSTLAGSTKRAWVMTGALNVKLCNSSGCTLTDRMQLRVTITPYQFRNRVEYFTTYPVQLEPGKNIDTYAKAVVREFYNYTAGSWDAPTVDSDSPNLSQLFDSTEGMDHWITGTTLIYGLQFQAASVSGVLTDSLRTSTATCYGGSEDYCAWP